MRLLVTFSFACFAAVLAKTPSKESAAVGEITTTADDIEDARSGRVHYDVFENFDIKVRVYGDHSAVVTGKTRIKGNSQGKHIDIIVQFTDTFVKQSGRWRLAAGHVSRLKE